VDEQDIRYDRPATHTCVEMRNYSEIAVLKEENVNWQLSDKTTTLFSPLGKLANRLYILPSVFFFLFLNLRQIISGPTGPIFTIFSPNEKYLREFLSIWTSFLIPLGTLLWQPIFGKICKMTYIQLARISQRIRISQFRFRGDNWHNFCYILCNFGEDRSTNCKDLAVSFCTFSDETAIIDKN